MTRVRGAAVGVALVVALGACGDGTTAPKGPSASDPVAGRFALVSVNALPLPFNLFNESGFRLDFTASTLALQTDGNYVLAQTTVETVAGFASTYQDTLRGTWTQSTGSVTMKGTDGGATTATWDGRDLRVALNSEGQTLRTIYRKGP